MSKYRDRDEGFRQGQKEKPKCVTDEHLEYLDDLRESGVVNMFGARPYLQEEFPDLDDGAASSVLCYWMKTFEERHAKT